ncbi:hypothetical protein Tco_0319626 [Tanacetum coccineum]
MSTRIASVAFLVSEALYFFYIDFSAIFPFLVCFFESPRVSPSCKLDQLEPLSDVSSAKLALGTKDLQGHESKNRDDVLDKLNFDSRWNMIMMRNLHEKTKGTRIQVLKERDEFQRANTEEDLKELCYIDSGCSGSMTGDKEKLSDFKAFKGGYVAFGNDPQGGRITGKGTIKTSCIDFEKVSYVEELKFNLLSVSQICDKKHNVLFTDKECFIFLQSLSRCEIWTFVENQKEKVRLMFDPCTSNSSMNYIPVRKENYADSGEQETTYDDVEDLDDQQFIVHGPNIHAAKNKHSEERTADKEVPLSSEEQALHDELRRIALEKGKECVNSTFTLSTANTPSHSTGNTPTDSDDDVPKDGVFSTNSFDDENEEDGEPDYNNMDHTIDVTSTPTLRIHKNHPQSQIIGKRTAGILTRRKLKESASDQHQALLSFIYKQNRTNHKDQQTCLFACFLSQEEPKKVSQALADESWVEADERRRCFQFKLKMYRAFNTLWEILHILDRQDLHHLYLVVQDYYKHIPPTGLGLILLGDLTTIWETSATSNDDFWKNQEDWEIVRWRLNESSGVHTLELEDGSGYHQKARKPSQNDKTEHGMEKTVQNQGQSPKMPKSESILKNQQSNRSRN